MLILTIIAYVHVCWFIIMHQSDICINHLVAAVAFNVRFSPLFMACRTSVFKFLRHHRINLPDDMLCAHAPFAFFLGSHLNHPLIVFLAGLSINLIFIPYESSTGKVLLPSLVVPASSIAWRE